MKSFKEWFLLTEADQLDNLIAELQKYTTTKQFNPRTISGLAYDYLTLHSDRSAAVQNLLTTDTDKYKQYNAVYKQLLEMVAQRLGTIGYTYENNGAWAQFNRGNSNDQAQKDDNMTTKRYVSLDINDIWAAFQKLGILGEALNKVQLRPEANKLSFKVGGNYGTAMQHKDTIVIHFYDKTAEPQIDKAVQDFLNAAGIKESQRNSLGRTNFGKDASGTSDSQLVANRVVKYLELHKNQIPQWLQMPNFKQLLKQIIDGISMKSSHRAGVVI